MYLNFELNGTNSRDGIVRTRVIISLSKLYIAILSCVSSYYFIFVIHLYTICISII